MSVNSEKSSSSERYSCISCMNDSWCSIAKQRRRAFFFSSASLLALFTYCMLVIVPYPLSLSFWLSFVRCCRDLSISFFNEAYWAAACKSYYSRLLVCVCWLVLQTVLLFTVMQAASRSLNSFSKTSRFCCVAGNRSTVAKGSFQFRCVGNVTWWSVLCPVMWKGSVLCKVAQESQILQLVTFCKIDVILVQVCARKWSSRCMQ